MERSGPVFLLAGRVERSGPAFLSENRVERSGPAFSSENRVERSRPAFLSESRVERPKSSVVVDDQSLMDFGSSMPVMSQMDVAFSVVVDVFSTAAPAIRSSLMI